VVAVASVRVGFHDKFGVEGAVVKEISMIEKQPLAMLKWVGVL